MNTLMSDWVRDASGRVCPDCLSVKIRYVPEDDSGESLRAYICDNCSTEWKMWGPREEV